MSESLPEQIARVHQMAKGDPTWDLSENDLAALRTVLAERDAYGEALQEIATWEHHRSCRQVIQGECYVEIAERALAATTGGRSDE